MAKTKDNPVENPRRSTSAADAAPDGGGAWSRTVRETIESIVIAFVLAFLFRTFEAEAFVIPTGSMAPTLMGRHMDLTCPKCTFPYQVGANGDSDDAPPYPGQDVRSCMCPNCRYLIDFTKLSAAELSHYPYYNGDRILVNKFAFDITAPKRWDVIVFKFPEDAKTNYIKRLIGLPSDILRIRDGDIAVSRDGGKTFEFAHKDAAKIRAMLQIVYDNDFVYQPFLDSGWPARWQSPDASWTYATDDGTKPDPKVFVTNGKPSAPGANVSWLCYYNFVPAERDWDTFNRGQKFASRPPVVPITDFIAYDTANIAFRGSPMAGPDHPVVTDLAVDCELTVKAATGMAYFALMKKGKRFGCQLDLSNGAAELALPDLKPAEQPRATDAVISKAGSYKVLFADIDHQLTLTINNKTIHFDKPTAYDEIDGGDDADGETDGNFSPASIGSAGAALSVAHLRVLRDVYYTYDGGRLAHPTYDGLPGGAPPTWPESDNWVCIPQSALTTLRDAKTDVKSRDQYFFVGDDQFFALGDNSPLSQDGRFWHAQHFVDRRLLVGKALFIYWPHSFFFPIPNFPRMGFVR